MNIETIRGRLAFLREAEKLKSVLRSAHTSSGRQESTAEHSWRLSLMAIAFEEELVGLDVLKVLKMCVIHDLGEAIEGDIPAISQDAHLDKSARERRDLLVLAGALDEPLKASIVALWDEYERASTAEAKAVKALDKLETILQHNQGMNPPDFDYGFNLTYGKTYMNAAPLFEAIRGIVDAETKEKCNVRVTIRTEQAGDIDTITSLTVAAFQSAQHTSHTEQFIVNGLRRDGQLTISFVAVDGETIVGHIAISPVTISSGAKGWFGLGPISVRPDRQKQGIGSLLMTSALAELERQGGAGCVVLGDPRFYGRFGFQAHPGLVLAGVPPEYFQARSFNGTLPVGTVCYHDAFAATE